MKTIYLPIDTKSLYCNIKNDNKAGHTCTVATPIKQGGSINEDLMKIYEIPKKINLDLDCGINDYLNKSSKSTTIIEAVFLFDKITINGISVHTDDNFCIFIKKEIDPNKKQYGRLKLHYPTSIVYNGRYSFNNKKIISEISKVLNNYAFIVRGFEYSLENDILNFDADVIGYNDIPYSKVFINNKGVGNKHSSNYIDIYENYDYEIIGLREHFSNVEVNTNNYFDYYHESKIESLKIVADFLKIKPDFLSVDYPYSFYDMAYYDKKIKKYIMVFFSTTKEVYFNLSMKQWSFMNSFKNDLKIYNVVNLYNDYKILTYKFEDLSKLNRNISTVVLK